MEPEPEVAAAAAPEPESAPTPSSEEGVPEPEPVAAAPAAEGGAYAHVMRRRLKAFLAMVESDEGWECVPFRAAHRPLAADPPCFVFGALTAARFAALLPGRDRGEVAGKAPAPAVRHWGRTSDILTIRFTSEIAAPAAAVWDIIRDGSRRAELDELLDKS